MCQPVNLNRKGHGMNFVSQHKRLAIYTRDGFACAYCGASVESGAKLTLDHLIPTSQGGAISDQTNLVTACHTCNSRRGDRPVDQFCLSIGMYLGINPSEIIAHVNSCISRPIDTKAAKELVDRRGSCFKVLQSMF